MALPACTRTVSAPALGNLEREFGSNITAMNLSILQMRLHGYGRTSG